MIAEKQLYDFCRWYCHYFGKHEDAESVFVTSMCGMFHSYPKAMAKELKRMAILGLITRGKEKITIL